MALALLPRASVLVGPVELEKLPSGEGQDHRHHGIIPPDACTGCTMPAVRTSSLARRRRAEAVFTPAQGNWQGAGQYAFAPVVLRDREQIVLLRPMGKVLAMTFLNYAEAVKDPAQFESEVLAVEVDPRELEWAKTLAGAMWASEFELADYPDSYKENVRRLIESKVKGKEVIAPPPEEAPTVVINLMDALQRSVAAAKKDAADRAPRLVATGSAAKAKEQRKRKSS